MDTTVEYGHYLAHYVANCVGCHTKRDMQTGGFIGKPFAGGMVFEPDEFSYGRSFLSPNLTPEVNTGIMATWTGDTFVKRFKNGRVHKGSPMPWGSFSRMNELDVKAIYKYLKSLDPVPNKIEKVVFEPGEKITKEAM